MSKIVIEAKNISKCYPLYNSKKQKIISLLGFSGSKSLKKYWALRNINLVIKQGERVGLIGKNGAGKSTLLKLISGATSPTQGMLTVNGKIQALMEIGTGFHPEFTGRQNITASLSMQGYTKKQIKALEEEIIDFAELEEYIDQPVKFYSAGMYSRLAFAVSTSIEPDILIIDEVLGAGDASFNEKCNQRMKSITEKAGSTVLFVSHSMSSVMSLCDRCVLLDNGKIIFDSDPVSVSKAYNTLIRKEEEISILAKEARLKKHELKSFLSQSDNEKLMLLFEIYPSSHTSNCSLIIYDMIIKNDDMVIAKLDLGKLTETNRYIKLSNTKNQKKNRTKSQGSHLHIDFNHTLFKNLVLPFSLDISFLKAENITVEIKYEITRKDESYTLNYFDGIKFQYIGCMNSSHTSLKATITQNEIKSSDALVKESNKMASACNAFTYDEISRYGSLEIMIDEVRLVDKNNISRRVFECGEDLKFFIKLSSTSLTKPFVIVICIMYNNGDCATQVFCDSRHLIINNESEAWVSANLSPCRLGASEYLVSIGIFYDVKYHTEIEDKAYCVLDRFLSFSVKQKHNFNRALGAFLHPVTWQSGTKSYCFDPLYVEEYVSENE